MTKVVQLSDEAYGHLRNLKRPGESFSDVVLRLARRSGLEGLRSVVSPAQARQIMKSVREIDGLDRP